MVKSFRLCCSFCLRITGLEVNRGNVVYSGLTHNIWWSICFDLIDMPSDSPIWLRNMIKMAHVSWPFRENWLHDQYVHYFQHDNCDWQKNKSIQNIQVDQAAHEELYLNGQTKMHLHLWYIFNSIEICIRVGYTFNRIEICTRIPLHKTKRCN